MQGVRRHAAQWMGVGAGRPRRRAGAPRAARVVSTLALAAPPEMPAGLAGLKATLGSLPGGLIAASRRWDPEEETRGAYTADDAQERAGRRRRSARSRRA
jgi:hypothetical protein